MNLVAKEYVAAQNPADPGVLVLSKFAGAANELDPRNDKATAQAKCSFILSLPVRDAVGPAPGVAAVGPTRRDARHAATGA